MPQNLGFDVSVHIPSLVQKEEDTRNAAAHILVLVHCMGDDFAERVADTKGWRLSINAEPLERRAVKRRA